MTLFQGRPQGRPAIAAAVLVTAAVVLAGGCGSGGGGHKPPASSSTGATGSTAGGGPSGGGSTGGDPSEAPGSAANAPKVPDARLTPPGGGTFTRKEKKYLSGRVPKGDDPAAVLEGGQEVCERLTRTSAIDPDDSASAIVGGDISMSGATAAVRALCPDQGYVLAAAARGFVDGSFTVASAPVAGKSVAPGSYHAPNPSPACAWRVTGAGGRTLASGKAGTAAKAKLTVPGGARSVTSSGCYAWLPPITKPAGSGPSGKSATSTPTPSGEPQ
jgi:hypothetical protein